jgi:hypothetical protein
MIERAMKLEPTGDACFHRCSMLTVVSVIMLMRVLARRISRQNPGDVVPRNSIPRRYLNQLPTPPTKRMSKKQKKIRQEMETRIHLRPKAPSMSREKKKITGGLKEPRHNDASRVDDGVDSLSLSPTLFRIERMRAMSNEVTNIFQPTHTHTHQTEKKIGVQHPHGTQVS